MIKILQKNQHIPFEDIINIYEESINKEYKRHFSDHESILVAEQQFFAFCQDFLKDPLCKILLLENNGRYVCALRLEPFQDGLLVSGLETAPSFRNKGYATNLIKEMIAHLKATRVAKVYSHIHRNNIVSANIHSTLGFRKISETARLIDGTASWDYHTYLLEI